MAYFSGLDALEVQRRERGFVEGGHHGAVVGLAARVLPGVDKQRFDAVAAGDLLDLFLEWIRKHRSHATYTTRRIYCSRFVDFKIGNAKIAHLPADKLRASDLEAFLEAFATHEARAEFAMVGRSPLVAIAAVTFGVAGGFSANLLVSSLDPLLSSLTEEAARTLDAKALVPATCNYWFMMASTPFLTLLGWWITARVIEPRFTAAEVRAQIEAGGVQPGVASLDAGERRGLLAALAALLLAGAAFLAMALVPGGPLTGVVTRPGSTREVPAWSEAIVPMIMALFLLPGIAFGLVSGEIRSDRCVARRMGESMSSMGTYLVLAFFAGQAIAWFRESNLTGVLGVTGGEAIRSLGVGQGAMVAAIVVVVSLINLFVSSASAKWAFLAPILVPMLGTAGMPADLVQCAYRVGDSCTNPIAPLNSYLAVILIAMQRWKPDAGVGTLLSLLVPYSEIGRAHV